MGLIDRNLIRSMSRGIGPVIVAKGDNPPYQHTNWFTDQGLL